MRYKKGEEVFLRLSEKSPIKRGVVIADTGLNRVWIRFLPYKHKAPKDLSTVFAVDRQLVFL